MAAAPIEILLPEAPKLATPPLSAVPPPKADEVAKPVLLDLGCGQNKKEGFTGVDFVAADGVDVVHDLRSYPWPFEDNSVDEVHCSHFFEHIPGLERPRFMDEVFRIMKVGAKATFITPFWSSERSVQDFTHAWPPIAAPSYLYFNKNWRDVNKLTHGFYEMKCDFDVSFPGQGIDVMWMSRNADALAFGAKHYVNVGTDIFAQLVKRA